MGARTTPLRTTNSRCFTTTKPNNFTQSTRKMTVHNLADKTSFGTSVYNASGDKLVVVDCFATWCGPCKVIAPEFEDKVDFYKIDVDEVPDIAQEPGVRAMPTFMLFKNGEKVGEVVGANKKALEQAIKDNL